jgi:hypothetical protein
MKAPDPVRDRPAHRLFGPGAHFAGYGTDPV